MEQKNHGSTSFINIAVLLLFAVVIVVASTVTTYFFLSSKSEQPMVTQPPVIVPVQTNVLPTIPPKIQTTVPADETANWKVYSSANYGLGLPIPFEIKYPNNWDYFESSNNSIVYFGTSDRIQIIKQSEGSGTIYQYVQIQYYDEKQKPVIQSDNSTKVVTEPFSLNSIKGNKYTVTYIQGGPGVMKGTIETEIVLPIDYGYLRITLLKSNYLKTFNQILSTFRIIK